MPRLYTVTQDRPVVMLLDWRFIGPINFDGITILVGQIDAVRHGLYRLLPGLKCFIPVGTASVIWTILCSHDAIDVRT